MSDLATLFARDPLKLTRDDVDEIIKHLRESRHKFIGNNEKPLPKLTEKEQAAKKLSLDVELKL